MIALRDLTRHFGSTVALSGVTLDVPAGEVFGLLGANGAGKTTLLSILAGLLKPTGGEARVNGMAVAEEAARVKRIVGVVPQHASLYPTLSCRENLTFFARALAVPATDAAPRVDALLDRVGLRARADDAAGALSGGLRQRLNIALALVHDPRLILLDEPTTGLDPAARARVWDIVRDLKREGRTLVVSTHYMDEARALCDRVGLLERGRIRVTLARDADFAKLEERFRLEDGLAREDVA